MASIRSKTVKQLLKVSRFLGRPTTWDNLAAKRQAYKRLARLFPVSVAASFRPVEEPGFKGEWIDVPGARHDKVMFYFHGGGFVFDSAKVHRDLIARLASKARVRAFSLAYSLSPEYPFPVAMDEALAAYRWLMETYTPKDIVFAGDSAGGSMVLSLLQILRNEKMPYPAAVVAMSPATDASNVKAEAETMPDRDFFINQQNLEFFIDSYFQKTSRVDPVASPLHGPLYGFPPMLLLADKGEIMYGNVVRYVDKAKREGVEVTFIESQGLWHVWPLFARYVPEARVTVDQMGSFIRRHYHTGLSGA